MTKKEALNIMILLSVLESWFFSTGSKLPDYLFEELSDAQDKLAKIVLGESNEH